MDWLSPVPNYRFSESDKTCYTLKFKGHAIQRIILILTYKIYLHFLKKNVSTEMNKDEFMAKKAGQKSIIM